MLPIRSVLSCFCLFLLCGCASEPVTVDQPTPPRDSHQMQRVSDALAKLDGKPIEDCTPDEARRLPTLADAARTAAKPPAVAWGGIVQPVTLKTAAGDVKVHVYSGGGEHEIVPLIVYAHDGGWVLNPSTEADATCEALLLGAHATVISVDYDLAPEHRFPSAHEQVYAVLQYVMAHAGAFHSDASHVAIAGEGAGGNIAAAACLMAKDRGGKMPCAQLLIYPFTQPTFDTSSYHENANARPLGKAAVQWYFRHELRNGDDLNNRYFAPLFARDVKGLPPATIITAEIDPLHDDGQLYADKLKSAGVDVAYKDYADVTHGFFSLTGAVDEAAAAQKFACERLGKAFRK